jgi:predicted dehydrogenase
VKDPALLKPAARNYADLPGGHSEGYDDTFKQVFRRFYESIADSSSGCGYPQFADGLRQLAILNAVLESNRKCGWVDVPVPSTI